MPPKKQPCRARNSPKMGKKTRKGGQFPAVGGKCLILTEMEIEPPSLDGQQSPTLNSRRTFLKKKMCDMLITETNACRRGRSESVHGGTPTHAVRPNAPR